MTANQIALAKLKEEERANKEAEDLRTQQFLHQQKMDIATHHMKSYDVASNIQLRRAQTINQYLGAFSTGVKSITGVFGSIGA